VTKRRRVLSSKTLNRAILNAMKIDFDPPKIPPIYPGKTTAAAVISIDFDHLTKSKSSESSRWIPEKSDALLKRNRIGTRELVKLSEHHSVPMTWAICGETAEADHESYVSILESSQPQEIGIHTYSHIDVSACSETELQLDIEKCLDVLKLPEHPRTFIFPWNRQGHFDFLKKYGFTSFRDQARIIGAPRMAGGLLNIPPTYYVDQKSFDAAKLINQYLDLCISWNSVFHLWLHPWSIVPGNDENSAKIFVEKTLDPIFSYMNKKRNEGLLSLCTMRELSDSFYR
jgi:peptidoglycan/xylan/chitin deacetylase (PgdA/CDA1 family)